MRRATSSPALGTQIQRQKVVEAELNRRLRAVSAEKGLAQGTVFGSFRNLDQAWELTPGPRALDAGQISAEKRTYLQAVAAWLKRKGANGGVIPNGVVLGFSILQLVLW